MHQDQLLQSVMTKMKAAGFDRVQLSLTESDRHEFNIQHNEIKLLRTGFDRRLNFSAISSQRQAMLTINRLDSQALDAAVEQLRQMAAGAQPDQAHDIAPAQPAASFQAGPAEADYELMYSRLDEFAAHSRHNYPTTILEEATLDFTARRTRLINTNGVEFTIRRGIYGFVALFTSKLGEAVSSLNYSGYSARELDLQLWRRGYLDQLLQQSTEQVHTGHIPEKFSGPVIITPHALDDFLGFLTDQIDTGPMIAGTSIYRDKLGTPVASELLSIHCRPRGEEIADGYFVTGDGLQAQDMTLVEQGVLKTYLLDIYGANKTGLDHALNDGGCLVVEPGNQALEQMIAGIERGLLLCRFSSGEPNDKGDFSGVAKNSYYIEKGQVVQPLSETMVSGNIVRLLHDIDAVSKERVDFGSELLPWIRVGGLTIS